MGKDMESDEFRQSIVDDEQLRLLSIFYWVSGGVTLLFSLYFLMYAGLGSAFLFMPANPDGSSPPDSFGLVFTAIGLLGFVLVGAVGGLQIKAGFWLRERRHRVTIMVLAAISCLGVPYGTLLGVLTFLALARPSVVALFGEDSASQTGSLSPDAAICPACGAGYDERDYVDMETARCSRCGEMLRPPTT
jgi:hypothetical protein